jgi:hypothetical protein
MLFLLNNVVLDLDPVALTPPLAAQSFHRLSLDFVRRLGCELYAEQPMLQAVEPGRARRLAALIAAKAPGVNGALFVAPSFNCPIDEVHTQFAELGFEVMVWLNQLQKAGRLTHLSADRQVWRRMAA